LIKAVLAVIRSQDSLRYMTDTAKLQLSIVGKDKNVI